MARQSKKIEVPIWEKNNLTLEEAAAYFNIGVNRIRDLADHHEDEFVLWIGSRRVIKRKKFEEYLENIHEI